MIYSRIIRFVLIFSVLLLPVWLYYTLNKTKNQEALKRTIISQTNTNVLYAGGSSISFAIRDSNNVSDLSEPYLFTLKKIQLLKPKKVFLSVGLNYFLKHYDKTYENGLMTKTAYQYLWNTLSEEEKNSIVLLTTFETRAFNSIQKVFPFIGTKMTTEDRTRILGGNYYTGSVSKINTFMLRARINELFPKGLPEWSDQQWFYFERILAYSKEHHIEIVLITPPLNQTFIQGFPKHAQRIYQNKLNVYIQTYQLLHADYTNLPLPDSCFFDGDHLNDLGAAYFASYIQTNILFK